MTDAAFTATFANVKNVPSRKTVQFVFELPVEQSKGALDILGGIPDPSVSVHVAIARLVVKPAPEKPKRDRLTSERAAMLCHDGEFISWFSDKYPRRHPQMDFIETFRIYLGITTRRELDTDPDARARFEALETEFLQSQGRMASDR